MADKYCDGLGACLGGCPRGALKLVERETDAFDEEAVEEMLKAQKAQKLSVPMNGGGCPSARIKTFPMAGPGPAGVKEIVPGGPSALGHWPVQIRLVPAGAPFLRGCGSAYRR